MKINIILVLLLIGAVSWLYAQENTPVSIPGAITTTPQSQQFERYLNHTISEYNGLPEISIPIYEIVVKGLKIPITLNYHASGIRYMQYDGDVGAGWTVNVGGFRVIRNVYGRPDERSNWYDKSYMESLQGHQRESYLADIACIFGEGAKMYPQIKGILDSEYDQFSYILPNTNGHFIIPDRTKNNVSILEEHSDEIIVNNGAPLGYFSHNQTGTIDSIKITDTSGFTYLMGGESKNTTEYDFQGGVHVNTAWLLRKIISPLNESIRFRYENHIINTPELSKKPFVSLEIQEAESLVGSWLPDYGSFHSSCSYNFVIHSSHKNSLFISTIETDNEIISFERGAKHSCSYILNAIVIRRKSDDKIVRQIFLENSEPIWHQLLNGVKIGTDRNNIMKEYVFNYYLPPSDCKMDNTYPDLWGYYSGYRPVNSVNGGHFVIPASFKEDPIIYTQNQNISRQIPLYQLTSLLPPSIWAERDTTHIEALPYFSLQSITFPTGGKTEYIYEPNQYDYYGSLIKGGGQRVKEIISSSNDSETITTKFKYGINEDGIGYSNIHIENHNFRNMNYFFNFDGAPHYSNNTYDLQFTRTYSMTPIESSVWSHFSVKYDCVSRYEYSIKGDSCIGKTVAEYDFNKNFFSISNFNDIEIPPGAAWSHSQISPGFDIIKVGHYVYDKPILKNRKHYNSKGILVMEDILEYDNQIPNNIYEGLITNQQVFCSRYIIDPTLATYARAPILLENITTLFIKAPYLIYSAPNQQPLTQKSILYNNGTPIITEMQYDYDDKRRLIQRTEKSILDKDFITNYSYPESYTDEVYKEMVTKNMISSIIQQTTKRGDQMETIVTNYEKTPESLLLPKTTQMVRSLPTQTFVYDKYIYDKYDIKGNLLQYTGIDSISVCYLWGYNRLYPIAKITNSTYESIKSILGADLINRVATSFIPSENDLKQINDLRSNIEMYKSFITTYVYDPLVGIIIAVDPRGTKTAYYYDSFNRLQHIKDITGNIIETYNYHYQKQ